MMARIISAWVLAVLIGWAHDASAQGQKIIETRLGQHRLLITLEIFLPRFHDTLSEQASAERRAVYLGFSLPDRSGLKDDYDDALGASTPALRAAVRARGQILVEMTLTSATASRPRDRSYMFAAGRADTERLNIYTAAGLEGRRWKVPPLEGQDRDIDLFRPVARRDLMFDCRDRLKRVERTCGVGMSVDSGLQIGITFLEPDLMQWQKIVDAALAMVAAWTQS